ncbi:glycoside hydrolase family 31 protein [Secundilactobacillus kimchicus]|uniref:glycoside hydrolase family 31 protein n=1 Tax=Secundilactobacillus kimchicus TaxID=528209 RepID=UPI0024A7AF4A|nr:TIM-barrel domain-containing protein [Secundilactobacillus kimchicus]
MKTSNKLQEVKNYGNYLLIRTEGAQFQVYLLNEDIIRIRSTFDDEFPEEESYALVKTAWDDATDDLFRGERTRVDPIPIELNHEAGVYTTTTGNYTLKIFEEPFYFEIVDSSGRVVHRDLPKRSFLKDEFGRRFHYSSMGNSNKFYGFGEKSGELNKFKRRMRMHNTDSLGWNAKKSDPLYKMIPFYIDFDSENDVASGLFYNNANDSVFDMDCEHSNYWLRYSYFECDGGDVDFFFIGGPTIKDVVEHYTDLTGKSAMMPAASLGYMGSTMFYTELDKDADVAILDFVDTCRKNNIPCDGFFLSSGYTSGEDGKRYVFNWNKKRFPNPEQFVAELRKRGVLLAPNIKPGMLLSHPLVEEFEAEDAYVKSADGQSSEVDQYWGGSAHFVDFTNPHGRDAWEKRMIQQLISIGITSIWNDNNEFEINNNDALVNAEGQNRRIGELKPVMPTMMAKAAQEAIAKAAPGVRPYLVNRAGFAGIQRYAQTWAGDNYTSWTNVKYNIPTILGMGLSGVANQGCDIGGFDGPLPEPELFVRWVQNGIFQPRFSIHSSNNDNTVTEPWTYPGYTKYIREAIQLRYSLIPYFYSLLYEASVKGSPIMRPLVYEFQQDPKVAEESFEFMLGPSLLVANVVDRGETTKAIYLPSGATWTDWSTRKVYDGGQTISLPVNLGSIPMFIRNGSIIPQSPGLMNIHNDAIEKLQLLIEPSRSAQFSLYEDDGVSTDYKNGQYLLTHITTDQSADGVQIQFSKTGAFASKVKVLELNVICPTIAPIEISVGQETLERYLSADKFAQASSGWYFDGEKRQVVVRFANPEGKNFDVQVNFNVKDLISI